jgi:hypothetical protein
MHRSLVFFYRGNEVGSNAGYTYAGSAEVGNDAFKPSDWRGCIKAANYFRLPLRFLLGCCELAAHQW